MQAEGRVSQYASRGFSKVKKQGFSRAEDTWDKKKRRVVVAALEPEGWCAS